MSFSGFERSPAATERSDVHSSMLAVARFNSSSPIMSVVFVKGACASSLGILQSSGMGPHHPSNSQRHSSGSGQLHHPSPSAEWLVMRAAHQRGLGQNSLLWLHPENHMPDLLKHPAHPEAIRHAARDRPLAHPLVIRPRPLQDPFPAHGKLPAAHVAQLLGHAAARHVEQLHVHVSEVCAYVTAADVDVGGLERDDADGAARVWVAAQVDVAAAAHRVEAQVLEQRRRIGSEDIVMPLRRVGVHEGHVGGQDVVVVDYEGQIGYRFAAAMARGNERVTRLGRFRGGIDVRSPTASGLASACTW